MPLLHIQWQQPSHPSLNQEVSRVLCLRIRISYNADTPGEMPVSPMHLPRWKAPALLTQKLLADKSSQAPEAVLCKQSCCTILSPGQGQAGEVRLEPTPAWANSSPLRLCTVFRDTPLIQSETPAGRWRVITNTSPWNRICFNFLTIHTLAFSTVNSWTGFLQNFCKKKHVQSHLCEGDAFTPQHYPSKDIPRLPAAPGKHNGSAGTLLMLNCTDTHFHPLRNSWDLDM